MTGLHSSDPSTVSLRTVSLSIAARAPEVTIEEIGNALYVDRTLVRILGMRRTMWVVPTEFANIIDSSSTKALVAAQRKRQAWMIESSGIAGDGMAWADRVGEATLEALRNRGEATARELTEDVPELGQKITFHRKDGSLADEVGASTRVLFLLATEGRIVRAKPLGTWISSQYRWTAIETWLGKQFDDLDQNESRDRLVSTWLRVFGPGSETDIKWWTGWTLGQVRKSLERVAAVEVELDGQPGWLDKSDTGVPEVTQPWVALLPSLDPTTMGWKERTWYLGDYSDQLFDRNGNAGPTVWVDGRIVGGWAQRESGEVFFELFEDVGSAANEAIENQAHRLSQWIGAVRVTARFRSPHDKKLSR